MALNTSWRGTCLKIQGLDSLRAYRDSQLNLSASYYSALMGKQAHQFETQFCQGLPPEWEDCILRLHNEREVWCKFPHASLSYFFTQDGWTIDTSWTPPEASMGFLKDVPKPLSYHLISDMTEAEYSSLVYQPVDSSEKLRTKYCFQTGGT